MKKRLLPLFLLAALPLRLWAWGAEGHRAVGNIAERYLTDNARKNLTAILGSQSLTLISTLPDEMRYLPQFKETAPWHYVNTAAGLGHDQYVAAVKSQTAPNAYTALLAQLAIAKDPRKSPDERKQALYFVVHLVGDIHQPMHTGHAEDKGGNDIKMTYRGKDTNLHSLWDSGLIDYLGLTYTEMGQQYSVLPDQQRKQWQATTDPGEWLWESYQESGRLYDEAAQNPNPDYTYFPAHADLLKRRIQQGGVRLAALLNEAFK